MEVDERTFKELIHRHRDMIWSICKSYRLSAAWTTEDAFHEVLCDIWRGLGSFDKRSSERNPNKENREPTYHGGNRLSRAIL